MDLSKLNIEQLVQYFNIELKKDKKISVNKLCDKLGIKKSTLKSKMSKGGYSYNIELRKYVKESVGQVVVPKVVPPTIAPDTIVNTEPTSNVGHKKALSTTNTVKADTEPNNAIVGRVSDSVGLKATDYVNSNIELLAEMLQEYKESRVIKGGSIKIELPVDTDTNFKTSIRLNKVVWEQFKEFTENNRQFKTKELVSQALLDYMKKHQ